MQEHCAPPIGQEHSALRSTHGRVPQPLVQAPATVLASMSDGGDLWGTLFVMLFSIGCGFGVVVSGLLGLDPFVQRLVPLAASRMERQVK